MDAVSLLGSTMGLGFVSGINLYAAVLTAGLGLRLGLIHPSPAISHLEVLANPYVLTTAGVLYLVEFFADKIPWVDSLWDSVHTLIRPLGAAALGATAMGPMDPATRSMVMLLAGGVALSSHSTKAGTRLAANHSPEPFSNIALSLLEDGLAIVGTWLAVSHPWVMLVLVSVFLVLFAWISPKVFRALRVEITAVRALLRKLFSPRAAYALRTPDGASIPMGMGAPRTQRDALEEMPERHTRYWENRFPGEPVKFRVRCVAGKGVRGLRNSIGYLHHTGDALVFVTRRSFRFRSHPIDPAAVRDVRLSKGVLLDRVSWRSGDQAQTFLFFKTPVNAGQLVFDALSRG
ncbi:MAG: DUF4126 domain-containing protein [Longimicrobiaceae bacterium]